MNWLDCLIDRGSVSTNCNVKRVGFSTAGPLDRGSDKPLVRETSGRLDFEGPIDFESPIERGLPID